MYGPPLGCKRKMKVTICGLRKCIRPCLSMKAQGLDGDAPRSRPSYFDSLEGMFITTGFESAGFDHFAISKFTSRPGRRLFNHFSS
jgi:hypothetical protein